MIEGTHAACDLTGFVPRHAEACLQVARRMSTVILFREPGKSARSLIEEGYAMKGFRVDTKSCTWGPMRGFVCVDPRLSKPDADGHSYADKNRVWTTEALEGHIVEKFFGTVDASESAGWRADVMPIVLSHARIQELEQQGHITPDFKRSGGGASYYTGTSTQQFGGRTVTLPWRLMNARGATNPWLRAPGVDSSGDYHVLCVEPKKGFAQELPGHVSPVLFRGFETILGMCNPDSKHLGFKACVTADYDLFAIWPRRADQANARHELMASLQTVGGGVISPLPGNVARMPKVDHRLQRQDHREHFRFGDVSARILMLKTMLNTALIGAGYKGGNAIHHNDEQGNMALAKGSLAKCLPILAFVPFRTPDVVALTSVPDFAELVKQARASGYETRAKPSWLREAGLT